MGRSFVVVVWLGVSVLAAAVGGCGDNLRPEQADALLARDAGVLAPTGAVTVRVVAGASVATWSGVDGCAVVIDKPGGEREEKLTGSDGRVTFTGLDFDLGTAAVTAYQAGSGLPPASRTGITADEGEVLVYLWVYDLFEATTVELSGTALNLAAASDRLLVTATNSKGASDAVGPSWSLAVWPFVPFTLVAVDYTALGDGARGYTRSWNSWVVQEHASVFVHTTVDLDMAQAATTKRATGTMVLPVRAESPLRTQGMGHVMVTAWESLGNTILGLASRSALGAEGKKLEYTVDWVEPSSVQRPVTQYYIGMTKSSNKSSMVIRAGYPTGGELDATFIDVPEITTPADLNAGQNLHALLEWRVFDPGVWMRCFVLRDNKVVWYSLSPPGATSLRLPQGPSTLDEATLLGDDWLQAMCQAHDFDLTTDWIERGATTEIFPVSRL